MRENTPKLRMAICCIYAVAGLAIAGAHARMLPQEPNNAALLYYQALVRAPDRDRFPDEVVRGVVGGTASAEDVRRYVELYDEVLETVGAAAQIPQCDWGLPV